MTPSTPEIAPLLAILRRHRVRFVLVGGVAAVVEGAPVSTLDIDIVHDPSSDNVQRLVAALHELGARYRTRPEQDRSPTAETLAGPGHHLLTTRFGPLDVLGVIGKDRMFGSLVKTAKRRKLGAFFVWVLDLKTQIAVKEELDFAKDRMTLPVLRETLQLQRKKSRKRR